MAIYTKSNTFSANTLIKSADVNQNFNEISTAINTTLLANMTSHAVLLGAGTTSAPNSLALDASTSKVLTSGGSSADPTWSLVQGNSTVCKAPTIQNFTSTGTTAGYLFVCSSANATVGATYTNNANTFTVINTISAGTLLWCSGTSAPAASGTLTKATGTGDSTITFSAATAYATYTAATSPAPLYIKVRAVGGGSGGAGNGTDSVAANPTYFGSNLIVCNGGAATSHPFGATGGTASLGSGPIGIAIQGAQGGSGNTGASTIAVGGNGGASPFGGAAPGGANAQNGGTVIANTGSGGGGSGGDATHQSGAGGGAGGFVDCIISSPSATYPYIVGTGSAGATGTNNGSAGAAGRIEITEYYQ